MLRSRLPYTLAAVASGLALSLALFASARAAAPRTVSPVTTTSLHNDTSAPLSALAAAAGPATGQASDAINRVLPNRVGDPLVLDQLKADGIDYLAVDDPVIQSALAPDAGELLAPLHNFEGLGNLNNVSPPDTVGDIGYDPATGKRYFMQWINLSLAIWEIGPSGVQTQVVSAVNGNAMFAGFSGPGDAGGACRTTNNGDPIVLFDAEAGRWFASQFALPNFPNGPFYQCIAVSATADPTGAWHRYAYLTSNNKMNDYPHFGVWPDGYYMSLNQYNAGNLLYYGASAWVFERDKMLLGQPARAVSFDLNSANPAFGGQLPSDLDGLEPPPPGSPNYFVEADMASLGLGPDDALRLWKFHVNWDAPASSTFGLNGQPNVVLPVQSFTYLPCVAVNSRDCVQQPGTSVGLDAVGDRIMHRLAYRNFGTHESLVLNHTVNVSAVPGGSQAGVRWYELRDPGGSPFVHQQSTFAPDSQERWMASIAQDHNGNLALGYNVSGSSVAPSIRYTGRLAGDPLNAMTVAEQALIAGGGVYQNGNSRWGDYSSLTVDPVDDCTFWLTAEYMAVSSTNAWRTRIGSFRFPTCSLGPRGTLNGLVSDATSSQPLGGALVTASSLTQTVSTHANGLGAYALSLVPNVYTVTAAQFGYATAAVYPVTVTVDTTTTQDLSLSTAPLHTLSGTVTDAVTGSPLWATLTLDGLPFDPLTPTFQSDAFTGFYSVTVPGGGQAYTLTVSALQHVTAVRALGLVTADRVEDFALTPTTTNGALAGYVTSDYFAGPVAGAVITLSAGAQATTTANAQGYYQFLQVAPGTYTATAGAAGHSPHTVSGIAVTTSGLTRQDFQLTTGRVALAAGVLSRTLQLNAVVVDPAGFVITNTGAGALAYQVREQAVSYTPPGVSQPQGGGPDAFGYTWRSSAELGGPLFEWLDATGGVSLPLADDGAANITLPFAFPFYGGASASVRVSNNGALLFNSPNVTLGFTNEPLGTTAVRNLIAPFWDDLDNDGGSVHWHVFGAAPNRRAVVQWHNRPHFAVGGGLGAATFEAVLFEDGDILFQYLDVDFGNSAFNGGASATVGLRGPGAGEILQFSHNAAALGPNLALCFDRPGGTACGLGDALPWLGVTPAAGSLPGGAGAAQAFTLTWQAPLTAVVPGVYQGNLWLITTDPAAPNHFLPVTLTVPPPVVAFASGAQTITERSEPVTITVNLSQPAALTVTVPYGVSGSATGNSIDHNLAGGSLVFPPGTQTRSLAFMAPIDPLTEPNETVIISLGTPVHGELGAPSTHTVTIVDFPMPFKRYFPFFWR